MMYDVLGDLFDGLHRANTYHTNVWAGVVEPNFVDADGVSRLGRLVSGPFIHAVGVQWRPSHSFVDISRWVAATAAGLCSRRE